MIEQRCYFPKNREVLDKIAEYLIAKETITGEEFMNFYREVKGEDLIKADTDQKKDDVRDDVSKEEIPSKVNEAEDNTKEESVSETDKIDLNNNSVEKSISEADKDDTTVE